MHVAFNGLCFLLWFWDLLNKNIWKFIANRCIVDFHTVRNYNVNDRLMNAYIDDFNEPNHLLARKVTLVDVMTFSLGWNCCRLDTGYWNHHVYWMSGIKFSIKKKRKTNQLKKILKWSFKRFQFQVSVVMLFIWIY